MKELEQGDMKNVPSANEIPVMIKELYNLPNFGVDIKKVQEGIDEVNQRFPTAEFKYVDLPRNGGKNIFEKGIDKLKSGWKYITG